MILYKKVQTQHLGGALSVARAIGAIGILLILLSLALAALVVFGVVDWLWLGKAIQYLLVAVAIMFLSALLASLVAIEEAIRIRSKDPS